MTGLKYFVILLLDFIVSIESTYTPVIQTESGPVRGKILTTVRRGYTYASFKGIPYAEPPIGFLRFKPPVEKRRWTNVFDAIHEGDVCTQISMGNSSVIGSEDCLSLNIYTPYTEYDSFAQNDLKAVMVWIYGGGFHLGSSNSKIYGPDFLLEDDVIVVSINYRLGPLGFLNLNHKNATGNAGLKDQNLALKWINKNIARFGGDPNRITIFGQSAGAVSVDLHVLSDMSKGLFSQSISMSGSPLCLYWGIQSHLEAQLRAFTLGSKLGIRTKSKHELLRALYEVPATDIMLKTNEMPLLPFRPTIEKKSIAIDQEKFLTKCSVDKYRSGNYNKGPHMMGFTSVEAKSFAEGILLSLAKSSEETIGNETSHKSVLQEILNAGNFSKLSDKALEKLVAGASDLFFVTGIDSKQRLLHLHNKYPIYYYRFSFESNSYLGLSETNRNHKFPGVGHGEDIPYLFYISFVDMPLDNPDIQIMVNRYVRLTTNFAKYGNPTPNGTADPLLEITWPDSGILGRHLEIGKELSVGSRPINHHVEDHERAGLGTSRILNSCFEM